VVHAAIAQFPNAPAPGPAVTGRELVDRLAALAGVPGIRVVVVGDGPELARLRARYGDRHEFPGRLSDERLEELYPRALALLVPGVEEFGIAAVEAQAAGRPVLGADGGGLRETVIPGETGELVPPGDVDAMAEALRHVDWTRFDPERARANAERFSTAAFRSGLAAQVAQAVAARA
jgi:glycosyltransferase involved in cell wall biosynthesis